MKSVMKKSAYYIIAANHTWRRGLNLQEMQKEYMSRGLVRVEHNVYQMVLEDCTEEEAKNVMNCFYVSGMGDIFQCDGLSKEDLDMIDRLFIGWVLTNFKPAPKKPKKVPRLG